VEGLQEAVTSQPTQLSGLA